MGSTNLFTYYLVQNDIKAQFFVSTVGPSPDRPIVEQQGAPFTRQLGLCADNQDCALLINLVSSTVPNPGPVPFQWSPLHWEAIWSPTHVIVTPFLSYIKSSHCRQMVIDIHSDVFPTSAR